MAMDFPSSPSVGQQVALGGNTYIWDGTAWNIVPQQSPAALSDLPPANPAVGQFWWRGTNGQLYVYVNDGNSSQWVQAAGQGITPNLWEKAALVDFVNLGTTGQIITDLGAFRDLKIKSDFDGDGTNVLQMQFSTDNGATFVTTSVYTRAEINYLQLPSNAIAGSTATTTLIALGSTAPAVGNATECNLTFNRFNKAVNKSGDCTISTNSGAGASGNIVVKRGWHLAIPTACNALKIFSSAGTVSGRFILEGVRG